MLPSDPSVVLQATAHDAGRCAASGPPSARLRTSPWTSQPGNPAPTSARTTAAGSAQLRREAFRLRGLTASAPASASSGDPRRRWRARCSCFCRSSALPGCSGTSRGAGAGGADGATRRPRRDRTAGPPAGIGRLRALDVDAGAPRWTAAAPGERARAARTGTGTRPGRCAGRQPGAATSSAPTCGQPAPPNRPAGDPPHRRDAARRGPRDFDLIGADPRPADLHGADLTERCSSPGASSVGGGDATTPIPERLALPARWRSARGR